MMTKELAKTLTTALVQFIDRERPEGTMDCSNGECVSLEKAFTEENFDNVETLIKKELARRDEVITLNNLPPYDKGFQDGKAEAMADLERTYFCNPDKLPKWLKDDIAVKELNAHTKGYNRGYKDAEKKIFSHGEGTYFYSKDRDVTYISPMPVSAPVIPIMPTPPSGWGCDGTHCTNPHGDCINCPRRFSSGGTITTPNTQSVTATATLDGNTSVTDGKPHDPSFTD